jgi:hypothetical protein
MTIDELRKYRIKLEYNPNDIFSIFNNRGQGIALFDLILTFLVAYLLDLVAWDYIHNFIGVKRVTYYLSLIPLGVIIHLIFQQDTFLNKQLFHTEMNIYQIIFIVLVYLFIMSM